VCGGHSEGGSGEFAEAVGIAAVGTAATSRDIARIADKILVFIGSTSCDFVGGKFNPSDWYTIERGKMFKCFEKNFFLDTVLRFRLHFMQIYDTIHIWW
jgi:hypothetical protein